MTWLDFIPSGYGYDSDTEFGNRVDYYWGGALFGIQFPIVARNVRINVILTLEFPKGHWRSIHKRAPGDPIFVYIGVWYPISLHTMLFWYQMSIKVNWNCQKKCKKGKYATWPDLFA